MKESKNRMHIKQIPRIKSGILIPLELRVELLELRMESIYIETDKISHMRKSWRKSSISETYLS